MNVSFPLGQTVMTAGANRMLHPEEVLAALQRHSSRDWGEVCAEDKKLNDQALVEGTRLLSAYRDRNNVRFWIITEADRSVTTILLPDEY